LDTFNGIGPTGRPGSVNDPGYVAVLQVDRIGFIGG